jgi:membrane fusion protein (multidrug efflux system)
LDPEASFAAYVADVSKSPSPRTAAYPVRLRFQETPKGVIPGMSAEVRLKLREQFPAPRCRLPLSAVASEQGGDNYAMVVVEGGDGQHIVRLRNVTVHRAANGELLVSGLKEGDTVVAKGVNRLRDGDRVRLEEASAGSGE